MRKKAAQPREGGSPDKKPASGRSRGSDPKSFGMSRGQRPADKAGKDASGDKPRSGGKKDRFAGEDEQAKPFAKRSAAGRGPAGTSRHRADNERPRPFGRERDNNPAGNKGKYQSDKKSFDKRPARGRGGAEDRDNREEQQFSREHRGRDNRPPFDRKPRRENADEPRHEGGHRRGAARHEKEWEFERDPRPGKKSAAAGFPMPVNKYIAHCGECSRRDAAELVRQGKVKVNGELVIDPGHKVNEGDQVTMSGKKLKPVKGLVYMLLNKPKGFITTNEDPRGRRTVMDLVSNAEVGRVYPIGRLDRNTTGLLLLTNDGDLAQRLAHPSYNVKKVYQVTLDKSLAPSDFEKIMNGLELEDGKVQVDEMAYLEKKNEVGLEIHSGKNRIVRRIFESLGYVVEKLDRVMYAGLTKKNLPRGKWRFLDDREIVLLKHFKSR